MKLEAAPDLDVSQWFNTKKPISLARLRGPTPGMPLKRVLSCIATADAST